MLPQVLQRPVREEALRALAGVPLRPVPEKALVRASPLLVREQALARASPLLVPEQALARAQAPPPQRPVRERVPQALATRRQPHQLGSALTRTQRH